MEVKMIDMKDIVTNPLQPRQTFDRDKLQELADSIREGELLQPIVVRTKGKKFEIVCGERRYKAFQILKEPKIPAIIRVIKDDTDALEKSLIENLQRDDLTSIERENAVGALWDSNQYDTKRELTKKLGYGTDSVISNLLNARDERKRLKLPSKVTTGTISVTGGLSDEPRKKLIQMVEDGKIKREANEVSQIARKIKEFEEPEQQMEILEEFEQQEEQSKEIFNGIVERQREISKGRSEPEHFIEKNADEIRVKTIQEAYEKTSMITSSYIKKIESTKQKEKAVYFLKKIRDHVDKVLVSLDETKVVDIE